MNSRDLLIVWNSPPSTQKLRCAFSLSKDIMLLGLSDGSVMILTRNINEWEWKSRLLPDSSQPKSFFGLHVPTILAGGRPGSCLEALTGTLEWSNSFCN